MKNSIESLLRDEPQYQPESITMHRHTPVPHQPAALQGRFADRLKRIKPLSEANALPFYRAVQPLLASVNTASDRGALETITDILGEHANELITVASIGSGIPEKDLHEADLADLVEVLGAIMVANQSVNAKLEKKLRSKLAQVNSTGGARKH